MTAYLIAEIEVRDAAAYEQHKAGAEAAVRRFGGRYLARTDDAEGADRIFDILMGTDVASRKSFIQSNAKLANLDI